jgi:hypothetical protein
VRGENTRERVCVHEGITCVCVSCFLVHYTRFRKEKQNWDIVPLTKAPLFDCDCDCDLDLDLGSVFRAKLRLLALASSFSRSSIVDCRSSIVGCVDAGRRCRCYKLHAPEYSNCTLHNASCIEGKIHTNTLLQLAQIATGSSGVSSSSSNLKLSVLFRNNLDACCAGAETADEREVGIGIGVWGSPSQPSCSKELRKPLSSPAYESQQRRKQGGSK